MREDEKVLIQSFVERGYDTFLTRCADGRYMSKEAINETDRDVFGLVNKLKNVAW